MQLPLNCGTKIALVCTTSPSPPDPLVQGTTFAHELFTSQLFIGDFPMRVHTQLHIHTRARIHSGKQTKTLKRHAQTHKNKQTNAHARTDTHTEREFSKKSSPNTLNTKMGNSSKRKEEIQVLNSFLDSWTLVPSMLDTIELCSMESPSIPRPLRDRFKMEVPLPCQNTSP